MMKRSTSKSSFGDFQDFIEDGSLTMNDPPSDKVIDKNELEERRLEMLRDNTMGIPQNQIKPSYGHLGS